MSRIQKYRTEDKIRASQEYLSDEKSANELAKELGMGRHGWRRILEWAETYRVNGIEGFHVSKGNSKYSAETKRNAVESYIRGEGSLQDICNQYRIPSSSVLRGWIKKYNGNIELLDYDPKPGVYVAMRRKTTKEERKEIVEYCLQQGRDYKGTAERYGVSYGQVYQWVRKYDAQGTLGLEDRRGHRKPDEELSEVERLRRENQRLKTELERQEMLVELLKKVKELEGM